MASLPSAHPSLSLHLTDPALTPLISSSSTSPAARPSQSSSPRFRALTDITTASLSAYTSASKLGLGQPLRLMIETSKGAPVILHSFLSPQPPSTSNTEGVGDAATASGVLDQTREALRPLSSSTVEEPFVHAHNTAGTGETSNSEGTNIKFTIAEAVVGSPALPNGGLGIDKGKSIEEDQNSIIAQLVDARTEEDPHLPPLLIATVVSPNHNQEARRAAGKLDRLGVEFQRRWAMDHAQSQQHGGENDDIADNMDRNGEGRADG